MNSAGCLSDEEIALAAEGTAAPDERARFEAHLAGCGPCRARWAEAHAPAPSPAGHSLDVETLVHAATGEMRASAPDAEFRRNRFPRVALGVGAAAAAAVLAAWGLGVFSPEAGHRRERTLPEGRPVAGRGERVGMASSPDVVRLPDGSRFRVAAGSAVMFEAPGAGERITARLARGEVEADIVKGEGAVRIVSDAGEIRVTGTVFLARAFRAHGPGGAFPVLSVEVTEGTVEIAGGRGADDAVRVAAGRRGIVRAGEPPVLQEAAPLGWREAARRWGGDRDKPSFASSWGAVTLLAGSWGGIGSWEEALDAVGESPDLRRVAAVLVGIRAGPEDAGALAARFGREPDEEARLALLPHVARVLGEAAGDWLARVAGADASARVRREALRLSEESRKPR